MFDNTTYVWVTISTREHDAVQRYLRLGPNHDSIRFSMQGVCDVPVSCDISGIERFGAYSRRVTF